MANYYSTIGVNGPTIDSILTKANSAVQPADISAAGWELINDASVAAQRATLQLGTAATRDVGTSAGSVCSGDDSRLTNARTPSAHTQAETTITFTDVTTGNATTSVHGFLPKLGGGSINFLRADGTWSPPPSASYTASIGLTLTGTAFSVNYGTTGTTACVGNDSRLSDARTPSAHTHTAANISDSTAAGRAFLTAADLTAQRNILGLSSAAYTASSDYAVAGHSQAETTITFTDITTGNATALTHGYLPKLGGGSVNFLRADGTWAAPPTFTSGTGLTLTGTAFSVNYGTTGTTACVGNDSRLSDARTPTAHTHTAANISDSTTAGRAFLTAADVTAQRNLLGLSSAAYTASGDYATAAQGVLAASALQPSVDISTGMITVTKTTEQLRLRYNTTKYSSLAVDADGFLNITSGFCEPPVVANTGTAYTIGSRSLYDLTLTGAVVFTFPTPTAGRQFTLLLKQDAVGSRVPDWPASVRWPRETEPTMTTTPLQTDVVSFLADGTYWIGFVGGQMYTRA